MVRTNGNADVSYERGGGGSDVTVGTSPDRHDGSEDGFEATDRDEHGEMMARPEFDGAAGAT